MALAVGWRRWVGFALAVAAVLVSIALAPVAMDAYDAYRERKAAEPHPDPASDAEQLAIVRAVFATGKLDGVPLPPPNPGEDRGPDTRVLLLLDETFVMHPCASPAPGDCYAPSERTATSLQQDSHELRELPLKLRRELVLANRNPTPMPDPKLEGARIVTEGDAQAWNNRKSVHPDFPDASGVLQFSRAVISEDGTQAMIYSDVRCGMLCGSGFLFQLERRNGEWVVVQDFLLWIS